MAFSAVHCSGRFESGAVFFVIERGFKRPSSASLIARYILRLGQATQKQQQPRCPNLDIRGADEGAFRFQLVEEYCDINDLERYD